MNTKTCIPWSLWAVVLLIVAATIAYVNDVVSGVVQTTIVTWVVLITASLLNLVIVLMKDGRSQFPTNIMIVAGTTGQTIILVSVLIVGASTEISRFDIATLVGAIAGFAIFLWRREHAVISALAINTAIVIGFIPLWLHLWGGGVTESLSAWIYVTLAAAIGFQKPLSEKNYLALVYPLRSTATSASVVLMTLWNMYL